MNKALAIARQIRWANYAYRIIHVFMTNIKQSLWRPLGSGKRRKSQAEALKRPEWPDLEMRAVAICLAPEALQPPWEGPARTQPAGAMVRWEN
eukprot:scaffold93773_cov26-Prasinocladus_malaysianus.AAC.1